MTDAAASLADIAMSQTMDHKLVTPAEIQWEPGPGVLPSSICLNEDSVRTRSGTISRRERPTPMSKRGLELSPRNCALSPATRGTPSAPSLQAGGQR
jgi:hypothetical protein